MYRISDFECRDETKASMLGNFIFDRDVEDTIDLGV